MFDDFNCDDGNDEFWGTAYAVDSFSGKCLPCVSPSSHSTQETSKLSDTSIHYAMC